MSCPIGPHRSQRAFLRAMVGWSIFHQHFSFALSLLVGFYTLLRTGELLELQAWNIHMISSTQPAVISLGLTKSGKRQGAAESVTLTERSVLKLLWYWKQNVPSHTFLTAKPHIWRQLFSDCLAGLQLQTWGFRPYSLRRGGATSLFVKVGSLDRVLLLGRWTAVKTAKILFKCRFSHAGWPQNYHPSPSVRFTLCFTTICLVRHSLSHPFHGSEEQGDVETWNLASKRWKNECSGVAFLFLWRVFFCLRPRVAPVWRSPGGQKGDIFSFWFGKGLSIGAPYSDTHSLMFLPNAFNLTRTVCNAKGAWRECLILRFSGLNMKPHYFFCHSFGLSFHPLPPKWGRNMKSGKQKVKKWMLGGSIPISLKGVFLSEAQGCSGLAESWGTEGGYFLLLVWQRIKYRGPLFRHPFSHVSSEFF